MRVARGSKNSPQITSFLAPSSLTPSIRSRNFPQSQIYHKEEHHQQTNEQQYPGLSTYLISFLRKNRPRQTKHENSPSEHHETKNLPVLFVLEKKNGGLAFLSHPRIGVGGKW